MMRPVWIAVAFVVALSPLVFAGEDDPPAAAVIDAPPPRSFDALELLPLMPHRWELFVIEHREHLEALEELYHRLEEAREHEEGEGNPAWRAARQKAIRKKIDRQMRTLHKLLEPHGVTAQAWRRIAKAPRGPRRAARFAHAQVAAAAAPSKEAARRIERLVGALDGAQLALATMGEKMEERIEVAEHRFWRIVDCVLNDAAKRALRQRLPVAFQGWEDPFELAMRVPGASVGQMARLRALSTEVEAEVAPDQAAAERLERIVEDESRPAEERRKAEKELHAAHARMVRLHADAFARLQRVLEPAQWQALLAVPPRIEPGIRAMPPGEVLAGVELDSGQIEKLTGVAERYQTLRAKAEKEFEALERKGSEMGPDTPQMAAMEMMEAGIEARMGREVRHLMREVFLDVLTLDQLVDWMLRVPKDD